MSMSENFPNRSDLRNPARAAFTGQTYGQATQQEAAQQAVPTGRPPTEQIGGLVLEQPMPGAAAFDRPTERPGEPVTAGADFGAGISAREAGIMPRMLEFDDTLMQLNALYQKYPNPGLKKFLLKYQNRNF